MNRACVFVDGENFRFSLKDLFPERRYSFRKGDYLPDADWHHFLTSIANRFDCELLRAYWYVTEHVDCRPYKIPSDWAAKERVLHRWYRARIEAFLRRLQRGDALEMPASKPMPSIGARCHELRVNDTTGNWRLMYRIDSDAIVIAEVFSKKSQATPKPIIDVCKRRLKEYDRARK